MVCYFLPTLSWILQTLRCSLVFWLHFQIWSRPNLWASCCSVGSVEEKTGCCFWPRWAAIDLCEQPIATLLIKVFAIDTYPLLDLRITQSSYTNHKQQVCSNNRISQIMISTMMSSWMCHLISDVISDVRRTGPWTHLNQGTVGKYSLLDLILSVD